MDYNDKAPFNMAINTLERIGGILHDIHKTMSDPILSPEQAQFINIRQVNSLYAQSTPLLDEEMRNALQPRVLELKMQEKIIFNRKGDRIIGSVKKLEFSPDLQKEILILIVDIQVSLQSLGYFMPPRRNLSAVVGEF